MQAPRLKAPVKRRRTIANIPHLAVYMVEGEKLKVLRIALDLVTKQLLNRMAVDDDLAIATWFSQLAYRLIKEKRLQARIRTYAEEQYPNLPKLGEWPLLITIPGELRDVLHDAAAKGPFIDQRGVTSAWLRAAVCYVAFVEKGLTPGSWTKVASLMSQM